MNSLRVAIIGCGARAQAHGQAIIDHDCMDLIYACDIIPERAQTSAEKWGATPVYDYREILNDNSIEAVLIITNVEAHLPIAFDCLDAGKHIIMEKPVGIDLDNAAKLVEREKETGLVIHISFQLRFVPQFMRLKSLAEQVEARQILFERQRSMLAERFCKPGPMHGIFDFIPHDCDQVMWYMGGPPKSVTAIVDTETFTRYKGVSESASVLLNFGDNRSAIICSSAAAPQMGNRFDIVGAKGYVSMTGSQPEVGAVCERFGMPYGGDGTPLPPAPKPGRTGDAGLQEAFVREIRTGERSAAARPLDGLNALRLICACHESGLNNGQTINF